MIRTYPIFHTLDDARHYCLETNLDIKKELIQSYKTVDPLISTMQLWAAPSIYFLQNILLFLYDIRDAYTHYEHLNTLEKHGLAHLIILLSAPYVERDCSILIGRFKANSVNHIIYLKIRTDNKNDAKRVICIYNTETNTKKSISASSDASISELKNLISQKYSPAQDFSISSEVWENYSPNDINYMGNFIHPNIKKLLGHKDAWTNIRTLRNRLAHPHEGLSEDVLAKTCSILTQTDFISDVESVTFLLSPLLPAERQLYVDNGCHNHTDHFVEMMHVNNTSG